MPVKPEGLLGDIKTAYVFHYPVNAKTLKFNTYVGDPIKNGNF